MSNINKFALYIFVLITLAACSEDFLDKNPLDSVSSQIFWASEADVETALAGVYSRLQQNFLGYERVYLDGLSDNAYLDPGNGNQPNMTNMTTGSISPGLGGAMVNMYSTPYRAIATANYFLENVDKAPLSASQLDVYKAEVRFIRALAYFDLVQAFGGVIIYRDFPETLQNARLPASTAEEVYAFIEEDLQFAMDHLPDVPYTNGHAVRGSAQALMARVLITQEKWAEAVPVLEAIMSAGNFGLSNDYAALFVTEGQEDGAVNREIIFSTRYLAPNNPQRTSPGAAGMDIELGWWSLMQPYADLVQDYEMIDGLPIEESPLYDPEDPYANRDPRLYQTIKLPNEVWTYGEGGEEIWVGSYESRTGYLMQKYVDLSHLPFTAATAVETDQDYIHLRYADVLLMYAEAKNEAGGPDASVYAALNEVRGRPGVEMPPVDESRYGSKDALRDYIRHERRIELALEGQRYNDLKRWEIAHIKLPTMVNPSGDPLVFDQRNYILPFPLSELDNNPELDQNPGY